MMGIDDMISALEEIPSVERENVICTILEQELKDTIYRPELRNALQEYYKEQYADELLSRNPKEIMDEYCEVLGFESLVDELNERVEQEYEDNAS